MLTNEKKRDARARRAARRAGLVARRSRWQVGSLDNHGLFMLVDPARNIPVAGFQYDLLPEEVVDYCRD